MQRLYLPFRHDKLRDPLCPAFFPVTPDQSGQFRFSVCIHNSVSCQVSRLVHPHIQWAFMHVGKPPFRRIQLIGGNPQIEQDPRHFFYVQLAQHRLQILKV